MTKTFVLEFLFLMWLLAQAGANPNQKNKDGEVCVVSLYFFSLLTLSWKLPIVIAVTRNAAKAVRALSVNEKKNFVHVFPCVNSVLQSWLERILLSKTRAEQRLRTFSFRRRKSWEEEALCWLQTEQRFVLKEANVGGFLIFVCSAKCRKRRHLRCSIRLTAKIRASC